LGFSIKKADPDYIFVSRCMPNKDVHLSLIIPAYNEESRLPRTLDQTVDYLKRQNYKSEILVVDDGSVDGTEQVVRSYASGSVAVNLLAHPDRANHGKGASVKLGMMRACGAYRLFMDADNSTTVNQVDRFWPMFAQGYQVVIGSRALKDSFIGVHQPRYKEIAGRLGNWIIRRLAVPEIADTQAGFKMLGAKEAETIFPRLTIDRWGYDVELLVIARNCGYRICEVPISWINAPGSKVSFGSYLEVLGEVWKIRRNLKAGLYDVSTSQLVGSRQSAATALYGSKKIEDRR
jgi:dolichyl-phosphate beta-glucosyltransferase